VASTRRLTAHFVLLLFVFAFSAAFGAAACDEGCGSDCGDCALCPMAAVLPEAAPVESTPHGACEFAPGTDAVGALERRAVEHVPLPA
jgi:hypothetical protein